jgi:hypothetical protein
MVTYFFHGQAKNESDNGLRYRQYLDRSQVDVVCGIRNSHSKNIEYATYFCLKNRRVRFGRSWTHRRGIQGSKIGTD